MPDKMQVREVIEDLKMDIIEMLEEVAEDCGWDTDDEEVRLAIACIGNHINGRIKIHME